MAATLFRDMPTSGADLSPCRRYRYVLWRDFGPGPSVMFIGLNPSTADEIKNDLTISKCIGFAKRWGFGRLVMANLYAFRATYPDDMAAADDPVGPFNLGALSAYGCEAECVIAAWGSLDKRHRPRLHWDSQIRDALVAIGKPVHCLGKTQDGSPRHPSRLGYATERELFWTPA